MYVAVVPNRGSPPAILLRESYRDGGKVKNRTLANLSHWPAENLRRVLKGQSPKLDLTQAVEITRSLPHGKVAAVLGSAARLGMPELIDPTPSRNRDLVLAMLVAQVIAPGSKLATARGLRAETATSTLGQVLGVACCDEDDLYAAMDWVLARKATIEKALAARHLANGTLVLLGATVRQRRRVGNKPPELRHRRDRHRWVRSRHAVTRATHSMSKYAAGSPPAAVKAVRARTRPLRSRCDILSTTRASSLRRFAVTRLTTARPRVVSSATNSRREAGCGWRSISPALTRRSTIRPVVDGCTSSRPAKVARLIGPSLDRMTSARNCGMVIVSSTRAIDRAEIATNNRDAVSSASVIASSDSSSAASADMAASLPRR